MPTGSILVVGLLVKPRLGWRKMALSFELDGDSIELCFDQRNRSRFVTSSEYLNTLWTRKYCAVSSFWVV